MARSMRAAAVALLVTAALTGGGCATAPPAGPAPSGTATAPATGTATLATPSPTLLTMPNVVGLNAAVAVDKLKKLGFTNIDLGTVDRRPTVILPQNWTVRTQSAQPGDRLGKDDKIVLGCARNG